MKKGVLDTLEQEQEVSSSLFNLFDKSIIYTAAYPFNGLVDILQEAGYNGIEWVPNNLLSGVQVRVGAVSVEDLRFTSSGHQSFRNERGWHEVWQHPHRVRAIQAYVIMPEMEASLRDLTALQQAVGREIPVVLYPNERTETSINFAGLKRKIFQPTPHVIASWGVRNADELKLKAEKRGYTDGFCLDLTHMRGDQNSWLAKWRDSLPVLLPFTREIHVSAGRVDQENAHIPTNEELKDLIMMDPGN